MAALVALKNKELLPSKISAKSSWLPVVFAGKIRHIVVTNLKVSYSLICDSRNSWKVSANIASATLFFCLWNGAFLAIARSAALIFLRHQRL